MLKEKEGHDYFYQEQKCNHNNDVSKNVEKDTNRDLGFDSVFSLVLYKAMAY